MKAEHTNAGMCTLRVLLLELTDTEVKCDNFEEINYESRRNVNITVTVRSKEIALADITTSAFVKNLFDYVF